MAEEPVRRRLAATLGDLCGVLLHKPISGETRVKDPEKLVEIAA